MCCFCHDQIAVFYFWCVAMRPTPTRALRLLSSRQNAATMHLSPLFHQEWIPPAVPAPGGIFLPENGAPHIDNIAFLMHYSCKIHIPKGSAGDPNPHREIAGFLLPKARAKKSPLAGSRLKSILGGSGGDRNDFIDLPTLLPIPFRNTCYIKRE